MKQIILKQILNSNLRYFKLLPSLFESIYISKMFSFYLSFTSKKYFLHTTQAKNFIQQKNIFKSTEQEKNVLVEKIQEKGIALVRLNRPKSLNALNNAVCEELVRTIKKLDKDECIRVIILTGNEKAFAAGADIKDMKDLNFSKTFQADLLYRISEIRLIRKPIIAAVSGYAVGGGCELAMMCDIILAAENAIFGQPEINIGTIPGMGGSQRLTLTLGKYRAMEYMLTGRHFNAHEAHNAGLVNRVVSSELLLSECVALAEIIAQKSLPIVMAIKECINRAYETSLQEGLNFERRVFNATFSTEDQKEGFSAFLEKRKPVWKHK